MRYKYEGVPASKIKAGVTYYHPNGHLPMRLKRKTGSVGTFFLLKNGKKIRDGKTVDGKPAYKVTIASLSNSRILKRIK